MSGSVTLCVLLWAVEGRTREMTEYEDEALAMVSEHGGLEMPHDETDPDEWAVDPEDWATDPNG